MSRVPRLRTLCLLALAAAGAAPIAPAAVAVPPPPVSLAPLTVAVHTGVKPQSKVWQQAGHWWAVLPDSAGTWIWRLDGHAWQRTLQLAPATQTFADVAVTGTAVHALLFQGPQSQLVSAALDLTSGTYQPWPQRPAAAAIQLHAAVETATIALDSSDRMWLAADTDTLIQVLWSAPPYAVWSAPVTLASGVSQDDISCITRLADGGIGVLWSNQNAQRFGFRTHAADAAPDAWSPDETPAAGSALPVRDGMADDHLNAAVAADGTLYFAVKTSYDTPGYPLVALLVRRPDGRWDPLHHVDDEGSRGIVVLDETSGSVAVVYTSYRDDQVVCRRSRLDEIAFGPRQTLLARPRINNVTTSKENGRGAALVLAAAPVDTSNGATMEALGVLFEPAVAR